MSKFSPLLAVEYEANKLDFSNLWMSPKLDGIRALVIDGTVMSRNLIPIPNEFVQYMYGRPEYNGLDGELICGEPNSKTVFNETTGAVRRKDGQPDVHYYLFDDITGPEREYRERYQGLSRRLNVDANTYADRLHLVVQSEVTSQTTLEMVEQDFLNLGYEGAMLRAYHGPSSAYKFGRSTAKAGTLLKVKRFEDAEAEIIGTFEEQENQNEKTVDELGHSKRSSHAENKVGKGRLGGLICRTPQGVEFRIGTGYTAKMREEMWAIKESLVGQFAKYKFFAVGVVVAPRFPVFLGLRPKFDA